MSAPEGLPGTPAGALPGEPPAVQPGEPPSRRSGRGRRIGAWGVGLAALAATGALTGIVPTEDDIQAPFAIEASVGGAPVSVGDFSARITRVGSSDELLIYGSPARSHWVMITVEVTGTSVADRATAPKLATATLRLGERSYSASSRAEQQSLGVPLVAGVPLRLDLVFEIAASDVAASGVLVLSPRNGDDRLAAVLEAPIDLAAAQRVDLLSPAAPGWVRP